VRRHSERSLPVFLFIRRVRCDGCRQTQPRNLSSMYAATALTARAAHVAYSTASPHRAQHAVPLQNPKKQISPCPQKKSQPNSAPNPSAEVRP
jgi:hypothetical protein